MLSYYRITKSFYGNVSNDNLDYSIGGIIEEKENQETDLTISNTIARSDETQALQVNLINERLEQIKLKSTSKGENINQVFDELFDSDK